MGKSELEQLKSDYTMTEMTIKSIEMAMEASIKKHKSSMEWFESQFAEHTKQLEVLKTKMELCQQSEPIEEMKVIPNPISSNNTQINLIDEPEPNTAKARRKARRKALEMKEVK